MGDYISWIVGGVVVAVIVFTMLYHPSSPTSSGGSRIFQKDGGVEVIELPTEPTQEDDLEFDQAIKRMAGWKPNIPLPMRPAKMEGGVGD